VELNLDQQTSQKLSLEGSTKSCVSAIVVIVVAVYVLLFSNPQTKNILILETGLIFKN
jgi:hypothetical protein